MGVLKDTAIYRKDKMGSTERKAKERSIRLDDIVDAAERVFFGEQGQAATMDDVAREADFSKRTVYKYFSSKDLLMLAISLRGHRLLNEMLMERSERADARSGLDRLEAYGRTYLDFRNRYPEYFSTILGYQTVVASMTGTEEIARQCYEEGEKPTVLLEAAIRDGMADGSLRKDIHPGEAAVILWADIVGLILILDRKTDYLTGYRNITINSLIDSAFKYLRRSVEA